MTSKNKDGSTCTKIRHNCDRLQYERIGLWNRLRIKTHLSACLQCKKYHKHNKKLTAIIQKVKSHHLSAKEVRVIKQKFLEQKR